LATHAGSETSDAPVSMMKGASKLSFRRTMTRMLSPVLGTLIRYTLPVPSAARAERVAAERPLRETAAGADS